MRILVLGDGIEDVYRNFTASRLCPEGPVPVLINEKKYSSPGGAGLVVSQLTELFGDNRVVTYLPGSHSVKERIFADDRLMLRMDQDSIVPVHYFSYQESIEIQLKEYKYDAVIVSDYDKGAFSYSLGEWLVHKLNEKNIPLFVDAKKNWSYFCGAFAMFPNKTELEIDHSFVCKHVIQKLGANGCEVDGVTIPTTPHAVRDVTGAGDVFLAAFVYHWLTGSQIEVADQFFPIFYLPGTEERVRLEMAAQFANNVAGISVEHVGTHIVSNKELTNQ